MGACSIDRIDLSAGFQLIEIAIHHHGRTAGQPHEIRHGAGMIDMGVGDQQKLDVARIKAKFVNRFLDASAESGMPPSSRMCPAGVVIR